MSHIQSLLVILSLATSSSKVNAEPVWHEIQGDYGWCEPIICPPGTQAVLCLSDDPQSTRCEPCPQGIPGTSGTYQDRHTASQDGVRCPTRLVCASNGGMDYMKLTQDPTADNVCGCLWPYYQNPDYDPKHPEVSPKECKHCQEDYEYLDHTGRCVACNHTITVDKYLHKSCVINSSSTTLASLDGMTDMPIPVTQDQPQIDRNITSDDRSPSGPGTSPLPPSKSPSVSVTVVCVIVIFTLVVGGTGVGLVICWYQHKARGKRYRDVPGHDTVENGAPRDAKCIPMATMSNGVNGHKTANGDERAANDITNDVIGDSTPDVAPLANGDPHSDVIVKDEDDGDSAHDDATPEPGPEHDDEPPSTSTGESLSICPLDLQSDPVSPDSSVLPIGHTRERLEAEIRINKNRTIVVKDLIVNGLVDQLREDNVLTAEDEERIRKSETSKEKARRLLDIVFKKSTGAERFIDSLRESHDHLYELLRNIGVTEADIQEYVQQF